MTFILHLTYIYRTIHPMFHPKYTITIKIRKALQDVEKERRANEALPIDVRMLAGLRETARLASTHYSTRIEGNRLTLAEVEQVGEGSAVRRGRDELEVGHYYEALAEVERLGRRKQALDEETIRRLAGIVMTGKDEAAGYREAQNVIRDSVTGAI